MSFLDLEAGGNPPSKRGITKEKDPSQALAAGVFQINTALSTFKRLVNTLGTPRDTAELREKLHKTRQHIGHLAKTTGARLKSANENGQDTDVKDAKVAKDFQAVLKEFQKTQKIAVDRESSYVPSGSAAAAQPRGSSAYEQKLQPEEEGEESRLLPVQQQRRQDLVQLDDNVGFNESIIEEREQGLRDIQQQTGEVNDIVKDLAVFVNEQGIQIDDIDSNIDNAYSQTTQANRHVSKAVTTQKSSNTICWVILVIFIVVLLILIIIMAA